MSDDNHRSDQEQEPREDSEEQGERPRRRSNESREQKQEQGAERSGHDTTDVVTGSGGETDQSEPETPQHDYVDSEEETNGLEPRIHSEQRPDVEVPQVEREDQEEVDGRELEDDVSIGEGDEVVEIPAFELEDAENITSVQPTTTVSIEEDNSQAIAIPQVETDDGEEWSSREFDVDIPEIDQEQAVYIPQPRLDEGKTIKPYSRLLHTTKSVIAAPEDTEEMDDEQDEETEILSKKTRFESETTAPETGETSPSAGGVKEDWLDPLECVFGSGGGEISSDEPLVICINDQEEDDFVAILETLVQRLYREKVGGNPDPKRFSDAEELIDETRWVEAEHTIFTAKLNDDEWDKLEGDLQADWDRIWQNRVLNELYAQDFGAIIFNRLLFSDPEDHFPKILQLNPTSLSTTAENSLIKLFWGSQDKAIPSGQETFGQRFNFYGERIIENQWIKLVNEENGIFIDAAEPDESAGSHHRRMKVFVIKWLVERLRDQGSELKTPTQIKRVVKPENEYRHGDETLAIADILCDAINNSPKGVFEVETLFAEDQASGKPRDKLRGTFTKYEEIDSVDEINIVLDNISTILHLKNIAELKRYHRDWEEKHENEVNFYTLDLENHELISVHSVMKELKELEENLSHDPL